MWQIATASASEASCGDGTASRPSSSLIIWPTCCFSARPKPTTARLISAGVYSAIETPRPAPASSAAPRAGRGEQRDAARVPEAQRAADVLGVKDVLYSDAVGPAVSEQRDQAGVDDVEPLGESRCRGRGQRAADDQAVTAAVGLDAAVAGTLGPGIDPEYSHANDASISFSSMSAFVHTFFVSSCSSSISINLIICCAVLPSS